VRERGGLAGILLTHDHSDHAGAVPRLRAALDAPLAAARPAGKGDLTLSDGNRHGPFEVIATPGHAPDHLAYIYERVCFTGDAVLGEGSVFIAPDPGALSGYLAALERLQARELDVLCPGHGPPVWEARAKLDSYIAHRLERESRLLAALASGLRQPDELLDAAWTEIPRRLRPAAAFTLAAHLDKLDEEGRLPADVVRPATPDLLGSA
jgi:glyoxylase-like metal-dependent hydrolase (beta-lactamase superfamily II)